MALSIIGTVALDNIKTPFGEVKDILGGSATHAATAAAFQTHNVHMVGVVGSDFPLTQLDFLRDRGVNTDGIEVVSEGKTFRWEGRYEFDMNQAHTLDTQLNVLQSFNPKIPAAYKQDEFILLGNIDPDLQLKALTQYKDPKVVAIDSMNYWIASKKESLLKTIKKADVLFVNDAEIRQLTNRVNLIQAARELLATGLNRVIIKKGEHGAMMVSKDDFFTVPAFPLEEIHDPTGAGDSFAGGIMGYLTRTYNFSDSNWRKAVIIGTVMASFNVEDFSCNRFFALGPDEIEDRCRELLSFMTVDSKSLF